MNTIHGCLLSVACIIPGLVMYWRLKHYGELAALSLALFTSHFLLAATVRIVFSYGALGTLLPLNIATAICSVAMSVAIPFAVDRGLKVWSQTK